ncbi:hypothetical protein [Persicobacter diffluens]|uniref:Uncharacterized protein n=1 Tax=Persicobacter diffluens TaxID=981 RepID=A0AAN5AJZ0_9BACT|nr:hypothetical protein PEDI_18990 [Persicobacter diffluens]
MEENNLDNLLNSMRELNDALESLVKKLAEDFEYADDLMSYQTSKSPVLDEQLNGLNLLQDLANRMN